MLVGDAVVVVVRDFEPVVGRSAIGKVVVADHDYLEVAFSDDRLFIMREDQLRLATPVEIWAGFGEV